MSIVDFDLKGQKGPTGVKAICNRDDVCISCRRHGVDSERPLSETLVHPLLVMVKPSVNEVASRTTRATTTTSNSHLNVCFCIVERCSHLVEKMSLYYRTQVNRLRKEQYLQCRCVRRMFWRFGIASSPLPPSFGWPPPVPTSSPFPY